ncbi:nuclease-related domain-containing protein [Rippkaea orientalis]|nr:nuclease-related domain-containing protein [Rippkaea orientalis]
MFPNSFNFPDVTSLAKSRIYRLLKKNLSDEFTIFHSVRWEVKNFNGEIQERKTDFIITSAELGILILEVKEGEIHLHNNNWYSDNNQIEDPFCHACDSKYSLLRLLKDQPFWLNKSIVIGHAVAFPDMVIEKNLGLHAPQVMILDQPQLFCLQDWTKSVMNHWQTVADEPTELGSDAIEELVNLFHRYFFTNIR